MNCQLECLNTQLKNKKVYTNLLSINIQIKTSIRDFRQFLKSSPDTDIWLSFNPLSISVHTNYLITVHLDSTDIS